MKEDKSTQHQALGKCYGIWKQAQNKPVSKAKIKSMNNENSQYF
jgi:hypothetical protein